MYATDLISGNTSLGSNRINVLLIIRFIVLVNIFLGVRTVELRIRAAPCSLVKYPGMRRRAWIRALTAVVLSLRALDTVIPAVGALRGRRRRERCRNRQLFATSTLLCMRKYRFHRQSPLYRYTVRIVRRVVMSGENMHRILYLKSTARRFRCRQVQIRLRTRRMENLP